MAKSDVFCSKIHQNLSGLSEKKTASRIRWRFHKIRRICGRQMRLRSIFIPHRRAAALGICSEEITRHRGKREAKGVLISRKAQGAKAERGKFDLRKVGVRLGEEANASI